jgi:hypothetical protein
MAGIGGFGSKIGKKIGKIDPLRGGDVLWEKAGMPSFTGEGDKNVMTLFTGPSPVMTDTTAPSTPTIDDAVLEEERTRTAGRRRGRSSTILSTDPNKPSGAGVSRKTLLGE